MAASGVAVTVVGIDRPGIVAEVTRVLYELGANLEDVTSTILRGHFSMILLVKVPDEVDAAAVEEGLAPVARELSLSILARPLEEAPRRLPTPTHMVSVYGADRPGIVYKVTRELASRGANITDLTSRLMGPDDDPVYALVLEVQASGESDLTSALAGLTSEIEVDVSVRSIEADLL